MFHIYLFKLRESNPKFVISSRSCPIHNGTFSTFIWSIMWKSNNFLYGFWGKNSASYFWKKPQIEDNWFSKRKLSISQTMLIWHRVQLGIGQLTFTVPVQINFRSMYTVQGYPQRMLLKWGPGTLALPQWVLIGLKGSVWECSIVEKLISNHLYGV